MTRCKQCGVWIEDPDELPFSHAITDYEYPEDVWCSEACYRAWVKGEDEEDDDEEKDND